MHGRCLGVASARSAWRRLGATPCVWRKGRRREASVHVRARPAPSTKRGATQVPCSPCKVGKAGPRTDPAAAVDGRRLRELRHWRQARLGVNAVPTPAFMLARVLALTASAWLPVSGRGSAFLATASSRRGSLAGRAGTAAFATALLPARDGASPPEFAGPPIRSKRHQSGAYARSPTERWRGSRSPAAASRGEAIVSGRAIPALLDVVDTGSATSAGPCLCNASASST
jgi:hypothetical protein